MPDDRVRKQSGGTPEDRVNTPSSATQDLPPKEPSRDRSGSGAPMCRCPSSGLLRQRQSLFDQQTASVSQHVFCTRGRDNNPLCIRFRNQHEVPYAVCREVYNYSHMGRAAGDQSGVGIGKIERRWGRACAPCRSVWHMLAQSSTWIFGHASHSSSARSDQDLSRS